MELKGWQTNLSKKYSMSRGSQLARASVRRERRVAGIFFRVACGQIYMYINILLFFKPLQILVQITKKYLILISLFIVSGPYLVHLMPDPSTIKHNSIICIHITLIVQNLSSLGGKFDQQQLGSCQLKMHDYEIVGQI